MSTVYTVVGQHRKDQGLLLLRGEDFKYYAYTRAGRLSRVELTPAWLLDSDEQPAVNAGSGASAPGSASGPARSDVGDEVAGHMALGGVAKTRRPMLFVLPPNAATVGSPAGGRVDRTYAPKTTAVAEAV